MPVSWVGPHGFLEAAALCMWMLDGHREEGRGRGACWGGREDTRPEGDQLLAVIALLVLQKQGSSTRGRMSGSRTANCKHGEVRWINLQWPNRQEESLLIGGLNRGSQDVRGCRRSQPVQLCPVGQAGSGAFGLMFVREWTRPTGTSISTATLRGQVWRGFPGASLSFFTVVLNLGEESTPSVYVVFILLWL